MIWGFFRFGWIDGRSNDRTVGVGDEVEGNVEGNVGSSDKEGTDCSNQVDV